MKLPTKIQSILVSAQKKCLYCCKPCGYIAKFHPSCKKNAEDGINKISILFRESINSPSISNNKLKDIKCSIDNISNLHQFPQTVLYESIVSFWIENAERCLENGLTSEMQSLYLCELKKMYDLKTPDIDRTGIYSKVQQSDLIRIILNGELPPNNNNLFSKYPINFQKNEYTIWAFENINYLEDRIRKTYVGGSRGISVRVAKGLYVRGGSSRGQAIEEQERIHIDDGSLVVTNLNIYFVGSIKSFRIPYKKSFRLYNSLMLLV